MEENNQEQIQQPQKLHECLAIIEQKTEPHYKAVACIDNKNINRVPKKELCKSVEATIDRVIQSCWTDYFISDSDVYFTVVILCYWAVRDDDRQKRFKKAAITILRYTNHHSFTGIEDFYLDNRDNTEFSNCLPEKYQKDLLRRRTGPTRMRDFAEQREQEISTWVNTELLEKLKNKTLYSSGTVELIVCFFASTDCMCALIAGISLRKIKASRPKVSFNWAQASLCCIFIRIGPF